MKHGAFPGQEEALRARSLELQRAAQTRATRRMFLGMGLGGVVGAVSGSVVTGIVGSSAPGREKAPSKPAITELDPRTQPLRDLALGPAEDLFAAQLTFVTMVKQAAVLDDVLCAGVIRLANAVIEGDSRIVRGTGRAILLLERDRETPPHMRVWFDLVRRHVR